MLWQAYQMKNINRRRENRTKKVKKDMFSLFGIKSKFSLDILKLYDIL